MFSWKITITCLIGVVVASSARAAAPARRPGRTTNGAMSLAGRNFIIGMAPGGLLQDRAARGAPPLIVEAYDLMMKGRSWAGLIPMLRQAHASTGSCFDRLSMRVK